MDGLGKMLLTSSLAFLAFLPAALSVLTNFYHSQRRDGRPAKKLSSVRVVIHMLTIGMFLALLVYFAALESIIHYTQLDIYSLGPLLRPIPIAVWSMSISVTVVTVGLGRFLRQFFKKVDEKYSPLRDIML